MDIRDLAGLSAPNPASTPGGQPGQTGAAIPPKPGAGAPGAPPIESLMKAQPVEGLKKTASVMVAISRKLLEIVLPVFGSGSPEGKEVLRAIGAVSKMTKGIETGDMDSVLKSLNSALPPGMKSSGQGDFAQMLSQISKQGSTAGAPAPSPMAGQGGSPMPMMPKPM